MNKVMLFAAVATWAAVAITTASPAEAVAVTTTPGEYATCTKQSSAQSTEICSYMLSYNMIMKFMTTPCSGGACQPDYGGAYTEWEYSSGRKATTLIQTCEAWYIYGIDSCAC